MTVTKEIWRPIAEADNGIAYIHELADLRIGNSYPIWARDEDGRIFEAVWSDNGKKAYWWDLEGESPVDPVEFMPHPLDPRFSSAPSSRSAEAGEPVVKADEPDGWQLVPVEPTVAMRMPWKKMRGDSWYDKYKAMLDAAPDVGKVNGERLKALQSLKILPFSGNALIQIVEGLKGSMEHGTWRDDNGVLLKDTNEWMFFYTTFKASTEKRPTDEEGTKNG